MRKHMVATAGLESRPPRARGLKPCVDPFVKCFLCVAPSAGAWIETVAAIGVTRASSVAPSAGAWIETLPSYHQ